MSNSFYQPQDLSNFNYAEDLGDPGCYPFTRGVYATMYQGRLWTMRQYAGFGTAAETNERYKFLIAQGQTGLSVAFDLPTQLGLDSDSSLALGEVGKVGVAIDSLEDMKILFKDIDLSKVSTSMTINAPAMVLLAMYMTVAEDRGASMAELQGTIQNDILKEYMARGTYIFPPQPSLRLITDIFKYCKDHLPRWNTISISGYHIREAGATAIQELAFTFANAITYVQAALDAGLDVDAFASRLSFFFGVHNDFMEEIAKFRAARRIWAKIMKDKFKAAHPNSLKLRFHSQTCGSTLTAVEPENNVVRVALQALAAVMGGTQSLHTNSKDEALSLPTEESVHLALRTQQIIAYESNIAEVADPLGGSYYLESLTTALETGVTQYLDKIAALGGVLPGLASGFFQREIEDSAYQYQKDIEAQKLKVVGLNYLPSRQEENYTLLRVNPEVEKAQKQKLEHVKHRRDAQAVSQSLESLRAATGSKANLFPPVLAAVKAYATLGEICGVLRESWGEWQKPY